MHVFSFLLICISMFAYIVNIFFLDSFQNNSYNFFKQIAAVTI